MEINKRIKEIRTLLKLSQNAFSEGIFVSNGYVAAIELGNRKVNNRIIQLICSSYGVSEEWLRSGQGEPFTLNEDIKRDKALKAFAKLSPDYQDYVLKQMDNLLEMQERNEK
ncbi:hypothetical protein FACS1894120_5900 [Clostridia bacterium]|nr:hypothetical protein FACS1894120_5900 [Clostridia bacterium]